MKKDMTSHYNDPINVRMTIYHDDNGDLMVSIHTSHFNGNYDEVHRIGKGSLDDKYLISICKNVYAPGADNYVIYIRDDNGVTHAA